MQNAAIEQAGGLVWKKQITENLNSLYINPAKAVAEAAVTDVLQRMIDEAPFELPARLIDRDSEWTCYPSDEQAFIRTYLPGPTAAEGDAK